MQIRMAEVSSCKFCVTIADPRGQPLRCCRGIRALGTDPVMLQSMASLERNGVPGKDFPLIAVSEAFEKMTGFKRTFATRPLHAAY